MPDSQSPSNPWFGISMALVGVIVGYGLAMGTSSFSAATPEDKPSNPQPQQQEQPQAPQVQNVTAPSDRDHILGNRNAEISLIEYSDYECPFCTRHHPTLQQAVDEFDGKVNWVYRHYPLPLHPNARPAAVAAECVADLGGNDAFWEFTDLVFAGGPEVSSLAGYATEVGVNAAAFQECLDNDTFGEYVDNQLAEGSDSGVRGTPGTIVYNNKTKETRYISGAQPYQNVKAAIEELL